MRALIIAFLSFIYVGFAIENLGTYGKVYKIAEEDILQWIQKNAKLPKISQKEIQKKIEKASTIEVELPISKEDNVRYEKIIYEVPQDIVIDGKLIAKKGTKINVLEKIKLSKTYIVLADYMLPDFVDYNQRTNAVYLITSGNISKLEKKYPDLVIYGALPQVIQALRVKKIPSVVYQYKDYLVIYEKGYSNGKVKASISNTTN